MKLSLVLCCAAMLLSFDAFAADEAGTPEKKPSLMHRMLHPFGGGETTEKAASAPTAASEKKPGILNRVLHPFGGKGGGAKNSGRLTVEMKLSPLPLKLSESNRLKVTLTLVNHGKKLAPLEFPTSQRIEVLIKNGAGKTIEQWSQDQAFANEPTVVTINPGERAEYAVEVATREMSAGQSYTVQGFFPKYEGLKAQQTLVPEK